jgi:molybdopterin converting factor small subunit
MKKWENGAALKAVSYNLALDRKEGNHAAMLFDLDRQYPGIRFRMIDEQDRIRRHIRVFVNGEQARDLSQSLTETDEVIIVQALSGG